jgi:tRNA threonylcarbamoyladenosine biosynthesis protein TsaB
MYILGIDTSSMVATVALLSEEKLIAEYIVNNKKNHSEKLVLVLDRVLEDGGIALEEVDAIAVARGPGSFTGIRIGMACAQGISHALDKALIGINTLDGLAYNLMGEGSLLCPAVDAQRGEVYTSLYRWENGNLKRLRDYEVAKAVELVEELMKMSERVVVLGDGAPLIKGFLNEIAGDGQKSGSNNICIAPPAFLMPRASSIAAAGLKEYVNGNFDNCFSIKPFYIRKSHAEEKWEERHGGESSGERGN